MSPFLGKTAKFGLLLEDIQRFCDGAEGEASSSPSWEESFGTTGDVPKWLYGVTGQRSQVALGLLCSFIYVLKLGRHEQSDKHQIRSAYVQYAKRRNHAVCGRSREIARLARSPSPLTHVENYDALATTAYSADLWISVLFRVIHAKLQHCFNYASSEAGQTPGWGICNIMPHPLGSMCIAESSCG